MVKIILLRHGQSQWNLENRFTGWTDVDLTDQGIKEAQRSAALLHQQHITFDVAFTSVLKRAVRTLWIVLDELDLMWIPVYRSWRLNERHYGALQGLNKAETAAQYGEKQVHLWRRSFDIRPQKLTVKDPRYPGNDQRYRHLKPEEIPCAESLEDTIARFMPYWNTTIAPVVRSGKKTLIVAHGNSLRALVKYLDSVSDEAIADVNIPTGIPLVYELDADLRAVRHYYLNDAEDAKK